jgi:hypothetical protein
MPYDPLGSGYGRYSRGKGEYGMQSIYGYGDQGPLYNPQNPNPAPSPSAMTPNAGMTQINPQGDFFTQLAGLMGGSFGQPSQLSPAQYNYARNQYQPGGQVHGGNIQSYLTQANTAAREANRGNPMNQGTGRNGMARTREQGGTPISMTYGSGNTAEFEAAQAARAPSRPATTSSTAGTRAPGLLAGNTPVRGERNPLESMPSRRRAPRASGSASSGRNPMGASSFRDPGNNARPGVYY